MSRGTIPQDPERIYLDHHAATPLAAGVWEEMLQARSEAWANPASAHAFGRLSRARIERARTRVAEAIGASAADLIFTAGGTEAVNLAIRGLHAAYEESPRIIEVGVGHPSVTVSVSSLGAGGLEILRLSFAPGARPPSASALRALALPGALVVSPWVDHELGILYPIAAYASVARETSMRFVVDGTQALGKIPLEVAGSGIDALALASHKIGGPPGAGALWLRRGLRLAPQLLGGGQERGRRAGSPDPLALTGFGAAAARLSARLEQMPRLGVMRDALEACLRELGAQINGAESERVPTVTNASVPGWRGALLVAALDLEGLACSSGSACSSGLGAPSALIEALYPQEPWRANAALRLSLGPETGEDEVRRAMEILRAVIPRASR